MYDPTDAGITYKDTLDFLHETIRKGELPEDAGMTTAAHEVAIICSYESAEHDPRKAEEYFDIMGHEEKLPGGWMWTCTNMLVPDGWENGRLDNETYPRIIIVNNEKKETRQIPKSGIVTKWDEKYGVPLETKKLDEGETYEGHSVHFEFSPYMNEVVIGLRWDVNRHKFLKHDEYRKKEEREKTSLKDRCLGMHARLGRDIKLNYSYMRPALIA